MFHYKKIFNIDVYAVVTFDEMCGQNSTISRFPKQKKSHNYKKSLKLFLFNSSQFSVMQITKV